MATLWLRCKAPFAAYRPMQAGSLRTTLPVMPYSSAWGLVLNLAGIETRFHAELLTTQINPSAPPLRIALGLPGILPAIGSLYQHAHSYPVGSASKALQAGTKGAKYHIAPVRREFLVGLDVVLGIEGEAQLIHRAVTGVQGRSDWPRYGLPFAGDNNLLFDDILVLAEPPPCRWYVPVDTQQPPRPGTTRLTRSIDRSDNSRTESDLVVPHTEQSTVPPTVSWKWTPRPPSTF